MFITSSHSVAFNESSFCPLYQLGYQLLLNGQLNESLKTYRKAFHMDETSLPALGGIIHCQLAEGHVTEAEQQLEFLAEVKQNMVLEIPVQRDSLMTVSWPIILELNRCNKMLWLECM